MNKILSITILLSACIYATGSVQAARLMSVSYGTITDITQQERDTSGAARGGAVLGGLVGLYSGRSRSASSRALRTLGGAAVGGTAGDVIARGTENVYTVNLIDGGTVRVVMDSGNFHRGDCVAVEQGGVSANLRRVSNEFCINNTRVPQQYKDAHQHGADQCADAKQRLLSAQTVEEVKTAEMVMNILCQD